MQRETRAPERQSTISRGGWHGNVCLSSALATCQVQSLSSHDLLTRPDGFKNLRTSGGKGGERAEISPCKGGFPYRGTQIRHPQCQGRKEAVGGGTEKGRGGKSLRVIEQGWADQGGKTYSRRKGKFMRERGIDYPGRLLLISRTTLWVGGGGGVGGSYQLIERESSTSKVIWSTSPFGPTKNKRRESLMHCRQSTPKADTGKRKELKNEPDEEGTPKNKPYKLGFLRTLKIATPPTIIQGRKGTSNSEGPAINWERK